MIYHKFRFGLICNFKVLLCRLFGHRINNDPSVHACQRCHLVYSECYYPDNWYDKTQLPFKKVDVSLGYGDELLRETATRTQIILPTDEKSLKWWDEGTDHRKCGDFSERLEYSLSRIPEFDLEKYNQ